MREDILASPLARRPCDLRHAAVSLWLNAVAATQVAEWAGHSVTVLLPVFAKCVRLRSGGGRQAAHRGSAVGSPSATSGLHSPKLLRVFSAATRKRPVLTPTAGQAGSDERGS